MIYERYLLHVFRMDYFIELMGLPLQDKRFSGNLFQPNQTAFVFVLGLISAIFLSIRFNRYSFINFLYVLFMSSGVVLTSSRAGLVILIILVVVYSLNLYFLSKIKLIQKYVLSVVLGIISGVYTYSKWAIDEAVLDRALKTLEDPRVSLFKQSLYIRLPS